MGFCWSKHDQRLDKNVKSLIEQNNRNCLSEYLTYLTGIAIDVGYYITM